MAQRMADAFNRFVDLNIVPKVQPIVEKDLVPDSVIRLGIRSMLRDMLSDFKNRGLEGTMTAKQAYVDELKTLPIALNTGAANEQHYEIPTALYRLMLGPWMKYSCGYWPKADTSFVDSETEMLELYCRRAELEDGMTVLDLGCGWGSVSLYVAGKYPRSQVYALSNSATQREYIEEECKKRGLTNLTVWTADINDFEGPEAMAGNGGEDKSRTAGNFSSKSPSIEGYAMEAGVMPTPSVEDGDGGSGDTRRGDAFDRVISIEMFEHCKNYQRLFAKVAGWLRPGGKLFVHVFTHATTPYHFEKSWMAENFFTGGQMPSQDLFLYFQDDLKIEAQWVLNGKHYSRTNAAWLSNLDRHKTEAKRLLADIYGPEKATKAFVDWRLFFLTLVECFAIDDGNQWAVSLYRFVKPLPGKGVDHEAMA